MNENETARIESFSDGVIAIAITLLILEVRVPHFTGTEASMNLGAALLDLYPSYLGYFLSFLIIGTYWANHHQTFKLYRRSDHVFVLLNIFFLMCIAFLPFPTAVLAEHLMHPEQRQTAITLYAFGVFLPAFAWLLMWLYASKSHRLIDERLSNGFVRRQTLKFVFSNVLFLSAIILSLWNGVIALAFCFCLNMLYLIKPKKPEYLESTE